MYEGDILIIDPHKKFTHGIGVVHHKEGFNIKRVIDHGVGRYTLCPQNPSHKEKNIVAENDTRIYVPIKIISMRDI